jgi:hypothetical protein
MGEVPAGEVDDGAADAGACRFPRRFSDEPYPRLALAEWLISENRVVEDTTGDSEDA